MKQFFKFMFASCLGTFFVMLLFFLIGMGIIGAIVSGAFQEKPVTVAENSVLELNLAKPILEREATELETVLSGAQSLGLNQILASIKEAKDDPKIKGIYLKSPAVGGGWATLEEIRNALIDFKKSGKFILSYCDNYAQKAYYLSTVADKIYLHPAGFVELTGLSAETMFLKDLLQKLDVQVELIRPKSNSYKSAGEMFILDKMSEASRQQVREYVMGIWNHVSANIAETRKMEVKDLNALVDNLQGFLATDALNHRLIDKTLFENTVLDEIKTLVKAEKVKDIKFISVSKYAKSLAVKKTQKDKIAVIYAYGDVVSGNGSDAKIYANAVIKSLRDAVDDKEVKAIVLRVNSPGGSAVASESMTNEVFLTASKKPLIASFSDVAASAGYEMSCGATKIVAQPITITGSIGVFGVFPNFGPMLKSKLGITFDTVNTNKNSSAISTFRTLSPEAKGMLVQNVENFYKNFCQRVATGRKLPVEFVDSIGRGRIWAGVDAKRIGLVDELGGMDKALELAAKEAKISSYSIVEYPKRKDSYTQLMEMLDMDARARLLTGNVGGLYKYYKELQSISEMDGVQSRMPYLIDIN